jgi:hypothetical protein
MFTYGVVYDAPSFQKHDLTCIFSANAAKLAFPSRTLAAQDAATVDAHTVQPLRCKFEQRVRYRLSSLENDLHLLRAFLTLLIMTVAMYDQVFRILPD